MTTLCLGRRFYTEIRENIHNGGYFRLRPKIVVTIPVKKEAAIKPTKTRAVWLFSFSRLPSLTLIAEAAGTASWGLSSFMGLWPGCAARETGEQILLPPKRFSSHNYWHTPL